MEKYFKCKHGTEIPILISKKYSIEYHNLTCCGVCIEFTSRPLLYVEHEGWDIFSLNSIDNNLKKVVYYSYFGKYNCSNNFIMYVIYNNSNKIGINWADIKFSAQKQFDVLYKVYENLIFE